MGLARRALWYSAFCSLALACTVETQHYAGPPTRRLKNDRVGYSLSYPGGWRFTGQVMATEFASGASCQSVRVVDFAPPNSGQVRQSYVQICWRRAGDRSSLEDFVRKAYGGKLSDLFETATLGGVRAYRTKHGGQSTTFFLQTAKHRLQVVAAVVAAPARQATRLAQVKRILASFSVRR